MNIEFAMKHLKRCPPTQGEVVANWQIGRQRKPLGTAVIERKISILRRVFTLLLFGGLVLFASFRAGAATPSAPELKLDEDCEPSGWLTKISLARMNPSEARKFWMEQKFAVLRSYEQYSRIMQSLDSAILKGDAQQAVDKQDCYRRRQIWGDHIQCDFPEVDASMARANQKANALTASNVEKKRRWAVRCIEKADRLSR